VLHARSLELLSRHGIIDDIVAHGTFNTAIRMFCNQKFVFEVELKDTPYRDTAFPEPLMISQADTEAILEQALNKYGKRVQRPVTAEGLEQDEHGVTTLISGEDGSKDEIRSQYVVGCDGAHSIVRKSAGLKFEGAAYPQDFILADVKVKWELRNCLHIFMGGQGFLVAFPVPMKNSLFRLICCRPLSTKKDVDPTLKDVEEAVARYVPGVTILSDPVWITKFGLHHRIADNYSSGRMFLAGDAAHIHSPAGGQGMNTGIQDAVNLGWKLASVLRNKKDNGLLDSYQIERYKIGQKLLHGTDRMFEFMATTNPFYLFLRNNLVPWIVPIVMSNPTRRANRFRFVSQLGIKYRNSSIVGQASTWTGKLRGGDRAPNAKLINASGIEMNLLDVCNRRGHHLFLFSGEVEPLDYAQLKEARIIFLENDNENFRVHYILSKPTPENTESYVDPGGEVHCLYGFREAGFALVRPDGHIGFIGLIAAMAEVKAWIR